MGKKRGGLVVAVVGCQVISCSREVPSLLSELWNSDSFCCTLLVLFLSGDGRCNKRRRKCVDSAVLLGLLHESKLLIIDYSFKVIQLFFQLLSFISNQLLMTSFKDNEASQ